MGKTLDEFDKKKSDNSKILPVQDKKAELKRLLKAVMDQIKPFFIPEFYEATLWRQGNGVLLIKVTSTIEIENVFDEEEYMLFSDILFSSWWEDLSEKRMAETLEKLRDVLVRLKTRKIKQRLEEE
jgi:hypothetical protein